MYANTAYEALYQLMGLKFQEEITGWITSQAVFRAALMLIFGGSLFLVLLGYLANLAPSFFSGRGVTASKLVSILFGLFLGISILKVGVGTTASSMTGTSWANNPYVVSKEPDMKDSYNVSLIFRLLSGSAEELSRGLGFLVDKTFSQTNSQMTAPNLFYKAVLGAATDTIQDPQLKYDLNLYTEECLSKALPTFNPSTDYSYLDQYFSLNSAADDKLAQITIGTDANGPTETCLQMKQFINEALSQYANGNSAVYSTVSGTTALNMSSIAGHDLNYKNFVTSSLLMNHYLEQTEGVLGMEKGTALPGVSGRIAQFLSRSPTDGILSLLGRKDLRGISLAASRSQELSDQFARAPHLAGFLKMFLIGGFPILVFFLAAGRFKPLLWWWLAYLSICLWNPIWALLYHTMTTLTMTSETMDAFGKLSDGLSLYAANLISSRMYQAFAVYSYLQLAIGPAFSGSLLWFMRGMLSDTDRSPFPENPGNVMNTVSTTRSVVSTAQSAVVEAAELL